MLQYNESIFDDHIEFIMGIDANNMNLILT
jgi:hypothetical protein